MAEGLRELTKHGVLLDNPDMLAHVKDLYEVAMANRDEWSPLREGYQRELFFRSPGFRYHRTGSLIRGGAVLRVHPHDAFGPALVQIEKANNRHTPLYGMEVPVVDSDGSFNIQRGSYDCGNEQDYLTNPDPRVFVLEGDPERLVVQGILGAAMDSFGGVGIAVRA